MSDKNDRFVSSAEAVAILKVVPLTLHNWADKGKIDIMKTGGGHRRYNVDKYLRENANIKKEPEQPSRIKRSDSVETSGSFDDTLSSLSSDNIIEPAKKPKKSKNIKSENICYARYSNNDDKKLANIEKEYLKNKYPGYEIVEDFKNSQGYCFYDGMIKIVDLSTQGKINNLIISENTNISQQELEILKHLIKNISGGSVIIDKNNNIAKNDMIDEIIFRLEECSKQLFDLKSKINMF